MLIVSAALLIALAVGGTVAYLQAETTPVTNTFEAGRVSCAVSQSANSVTVQNTGNVPAYIRVAVTGNILNDAGQIIGNWDAVTRDKYLVSNDWVPITYDGKTFYYYQNAVAPDASTPNLFKSDAPAELDHLLITVLAEAIQADGMGFQNSQQAFESVMPTQGGGD